MNSWFHNVFDGPSMSGGLIIVAKTVVVYVFLVGGLRLLGKRELGQMNIYDLIMIVVLGNAVQNAMINSDNTLGSGVISATILLIVNKVFNVVMRRSPRVEKLMVGEPVLILSKGELVESHMQREGVTREQVLAALREHGIEKFEQCDLCVLEVDGSMSVVPTGSKVLRTRRHYKAIRLS